MRPCRRLVVLLTFCMPAVGYAALPVFGAPVIYARTGITAMNLPNGSSLASPTLSLNNLRDLVVDVNYVGGTGLPGVFFGEYHGGLPSGGIVANASDTIAGDPQVNDLRQTVYTVGLSDDPFVYDRTAMSVSAINYPLGVSGSSNLVLTDWQRLGGRLDIGFTGDVLGTFNLQSAGLPALTVYATDNGVDASSPYSFLYTPDTSDFGGPIGGPAGTPRIASKVSTAAGFDFEEIRIFDADGTSRLVVTETEIDPSSPFSELVTNGVAISDNGRMVAFQANNLQGRSGIYRYDDATGMIDLIAEAGSGIVGTVDIFSPDVNDNGLVVFRGDDSTGFSSVFLGDGTRLQRIAGEGDMLETDLGLRQLGRRDLDFSQSGAPRINNTGDVGFIFQYFDPTNPASVADGSLLMLRPAFKSGDFNGDGAFDCADIDTLIEAIVTGNPDPRFDLNADGMLDLDDRDVWLSEAGAAQLTSGNAYLLGDATLDGIVDGNDFLAWNAHKFQPTAAWCQADFNADGVTDGLDFVLWNQNKFTSAAARQTDSQVPEPAATAVLILGFWLLAHRVVACPSMQAEVRHAVC